MTGRARSAGSIAVAVTGATGNVGSTLVPLLAADPAVGRIVAIARRRPELDLAKTEWHGADVASADLVSLFEGVDAVVHLAWRIQPSRDLNALWRTNVLGSQRVFDAAAEARVRALVVASSVGVYSPGPKDRRVDETWPRGGIRSSFYARHKAEQERRLDAVAASAPELRVVRLRPALTFKRDAAAGIRRLFLGPFFPGSLARSRLIPFVPSADGLAFQAVHTADVAEAYRLAIHSQAAGAFNIAAESVLDAAALAALAQARPVPVPAAVLRSAAGISWRLRLQPTPPGWVDMALGVPLMDCSRARAVLGWTPRVGADQALLELGAGLRAGAGAPTPPLAPDAGGPARIRELASGVGARELG
jgi:nucleoside-diphosphate-sugar epimerase